MVSARKRWRLVTGEGEQRDLLAREAGISPLVAQILLNRGISTPQQAREFLAPSLENTHDPYLLADMERAIEVLNRAIEGGEPILVFGDYDADGITGTALMVTVLRELGARVGYYIPDRLQEGYGLNEPALHWAASEGYKLIFTVDCGITAVDEVRAGREYGLEFIITDHHQPQEELPPAAAVLDPKREDCPYPFTELAGVGVAFKVAQALVEGRGLGREWWQRYLDLVVLGTVADVVPLRGENRIIVKFGLEALRDTERPGLQALLKVTGLAGQDLRPGQIGFILGPRLNACGRLGQANRGVELLLTDEPELGEELARLLDQENRDRQAIEGAILTEAQARVEEELDLEEERVIVLGSPDWHPGVIGIVASRLVELYYRPTVLFNLAAGEGKGSARSIPGFHIFKALTCCRELLKGFGGHEQAAGLSLEETKLPAFRQRLNELAWDWLTEEQLFPVLTIDAEVNMDQLDLALLDDLEKMAPFGVGNPEPVFACRGARLLGCRGVGEGGKHLKLLVSQGGYELDGIGFRLGELAAELGEFRQGVNLAFSLQRNRWQGRTSLQLLIKDLSTSSLAPGKAARRNWRVEDHRGQDPGGVLKELLGGREKVLVCVNTARTAEDLARRLREGQEDAGAIAVCHAGLSGRERAFLREALAAGRVKVLVVTSFFTPGAPLTDFSRVVWYDLNFNPREFYRLCTAVGFEGATVTVHLLYGEQEGEENRTLLAGLVPDRRVLGLTYLLLQRARREGRGGIEKGRLLRLINEQGNLAVQPHTLTVALEVLAELKLVRPTGPDRWGYVERQVDGKLDVANSKILRQRMQERDSYLAFQEFLLRAPAEEILTYLQGAHKPRFCREEAAKDGFEGIDPGYTRFSQAGD